DTVLRVDRVCAACGPDGGDWFRESGDVAQAAQPFGRFARRGVKHPAARVRVEGYGGQRRQRTLQTAGQRRAVVDAVLPFARIALEIVQLRTRRLDELPPA